MKRVKSSKRKKFWAALGMAFLVFTGGALAFPSADSDNLVFDSSMNSFKTFVDNPFNLINLENLEIPDDFDYIKELNSKFVTDSNAEVPLFTEEDMKKSIKERDYDLWKEVVESLEGYPEDTEILPREEFEILAQMKNLE